MKRIKSLVITKLLSASILTILLCSGISFGAITLTGSNFGQSTLSGNVSSAATSFTVASGTASRFPASGNFKVVIWAKLCGTSPVGCSPEIATATYASGNSFTFVSRGQEGTSAQSWLSADYVMNSETWGQKQEIINEIAAIEANSMTWSGNTTKAASVSGSLTNNHFIKADASGNIVDGGLLGTGTVTGPGSSTNGYIPTWNGSGGTAIGTGYFVDIDTNLAAASMANFSPQGAIKAYVDNKYTSFTSNPQPWYLTPTSPPYISYMVKNSGYLAYGAGAVFARCILPNSINNGDYIDIVGHAAPGWGVAQDVSGNNMTPWLIRYAASTTTACTGIGYTNRYDTVRLRGFVASSDWQVATNYGTIASYAAWQAYDSFTDTSATTLNSHTEDCAHRWTKYTSAGSGTAAISGNQVDPSSTTSFYYSSITPGSANYTVSVDCFSTLPTSGTDICGAVGRGNSSANTYYSLQFSNSNSRSPLTSISVTVAGTTTILSATTVPPLSIPLSSPSGGIVKISLTMAGTSISGNMHIYTPLAAAGDYAFLPVTDSTISAAGVAGIMGKNVTGGMKLDNFSVY